MLDAGTGVGNGMPEFISVNCSSGGIDLSAGAMDVAKARKRNGVGTATTEGKSRQFITSACTMSGTFARI